MVRDENERLELVMNMVDAAVDLSSEARVSYLNSACGDSDIRAEVESRLQWERHMRGFLRDAVVTSSKFLDGPFEPGERVAGRFHIIREVGRGGMGVVYQAFDEKVEQVIALKAPYFGGGRGLPPEARAAREVSHFNVCKVHELHSAEVEGGKVEFLSMEFIGGETLSARIRREGPLSPDEARDIALQICDGLAQAHRQGVIHGDLKSANVILTKLPEGGTRAVVTDFGLATMAPAQGENGNVSCQGGTFDYMAPELFMGAPTSVASDLFALGVIFHEMLAGKKPEAVRQEITESAETLTMSSSDTTRRSYSTRRWEELPAPWQGIVFRCLKENPKDRFSSARELRSQLETQGIWRKWILTVPAAVALLGAVLWLAQPAPVAPAPVRLAVLPFAVDGGAIQPAPGLSMDLADRLSRLRRSFVVIPPGETQRNQVDTPEKARSALAATHVLRTRLHNSGGHITVLASIIDASSGQSLQELRGDYSQNDFPLLVKALTAVVTGTFHLGSGVPLEVVAAGAYPLYVQGIYLLRRDNVSADSALPFIRKALDIDPHSALLYAALAEAQLQKFDRGYGQQWLAGAAQSVEKAQSLNADSQPVLLAAGSLSQVHGRYEEAVQDFRRALELTPNDAEAWKRLAGVYSTMNRPDEAIATYQKAIRAGPGYYSPYLEFGLYYYNAGKFQQAEQLFRRVIQIAPGLARGHMDLGLSLKEQGHFPEAEESLLQALRLEEASPLVLTDLGALYYQQERYSEAALYFERSVKAGPPNLGRSSNVGDAYRHLGRLGEAVSMYRTAETMAESEVIQNPRNAFSRAQLARLLAWLGERNPAEFEMMQALSMGAGDARVLQYGAYTFESLGEREKTLQVLSNAPLQLLQDLNRQPEVKELQQDPHFQSLLNTKLSEQ
jgi:tetratricopeptide (TPR) repeat protein/TolB-like protein